jgi:hypothetical protein
LIKYAEEMREKYQSGAATKSETNSPRDDKNVDPESSKLFCSDSRLIEKKGKPSTSSTKAENEAGIFEYADGERATSVTGALADPTKEELCAI